MEKKTMRPSAVLPVLLVLSSLRPSASICVPRTPSTFFLPGAPTTSQSAPPPTSPSPPPPPAPAPTPTPTPVPSNTILNPITSPFSFGANIPSGVALAVKAACDRTTYPDVCTTAIKPQLSLHSGLSLDTSNKAALYLVVELMVKAAKEQTQLALTQISKGANDPATNPQVATILKGCVSKYKDASDEFDTVLKAISAKDIPTAQTYLSGVLTDYSTCVGGDAPGDPTLGASSSWVASSKSLVYLVDNCLDLCAMLR